METTDNKSKDRNGWVSAWLIFIIFVNSITLAINVFKPNSIVKSLHNPTQFIMLLYSLVAVINILCALMLLKWKKWAFFGFIVSGLIGAALNFYGGSSIFISLVGLLGIPILYEILQIKKDGVRAWDNLD